MARRAGGTVTHAENHGGNPADIPPLLEPNPALALLGGGASLKELADAAKECRACPLYAGATQTVFGEGSSRAPIF